MARKVIVSCAITGGADTVGKHPAIPVTPEEIAASAVEAAAAGAAIAHIHVRDPETGKASMDLDLYREAHDRVRDSGNNMIINLTTGPGARFYPGENDPLDRHPSSTYKTPEFRVRHVEAIRPEICSLDIATLNFGTYVFINTPGHLEIMAGLIKAAGVKPELEVFDTGHVRLARHLIDEGHIATPALFQLCLGIPWGAPANIETMTLMKNMLPDGAQWAAFGIGRDQFPMVAAATLLGGHVRVGLEDNLYLERGVPAPNNAALVEKAVHIITAMGAHIATPDEAREILGLASA